MGPQDAIRVTLHFFNHEIGRITIVPSMSQRVRHMRGWTLLETLSAQELLFGLIGKQREHFSVRHDPERAPREGIRNDPHPCPERSHPMLAES